MQYQNLSLPLYSPRSTLKTLIFYHTLLLISLGCHGYRYLMQNIEWLQEQLGDNDDDYFLFDCPGEL